jgi:uncharacterized protein (DUF433 family)
MKAKRCGRYVVTDPKVCHGKLTFRGTRIMVSVVLELVAEGMDWDDIIKECRGRITRAAIADGIRVAGALLERPVPA